VGKLAQVFGVQVEVGGPGTHDDRSQIMYSRIFSWGVIGVVLQYVVRFAWVGNCATTQAPLVQLSLEQALPCEHWPLPVVEFVTWKSLKMAWPHCAVWPTGVSNV
jgi:hypothetical protein